MEFHVATAIIIIVSCPLVLTQTSTIPPIFSGPPPQPRECTPYQPPLFSEPSDPFACLRESAKNANIRDPDVDKSIIQISIENGYSIENYTVTTSDGYILTTFRIPGGRKSPARRGKPTVLLLHGWGTSCESWIILPNDKNLAYMLADDGWDVWLGNHRGSSYSILHRTLNANVDLEYWNFSLHEMGLFDFPAILEQILSVSGHEKTFVVGHSQGAAAVLAGTSEIPHVNEKIHAAYLMAPSAFVGSVYEPSLEALSELVNRATQEQIFRLIRGRFDLRRPQVLFKALGIRRFDLCQPRALRCGLCDLYSFGPFYFNPSQANYTNLPRMISKLLDVGTFRSVIHFNQNARSCQFRYYDHGPTENMRRYRSQTPPSYQLHQIRAPIYLFWAEHDAMIPPPDIQRLAEAISQEALRAVIRVDYDNFEHLDFLLGRDANDLVYKPLINMMNQERIGLSFA